MSEVTTAHAPQDTLDALAVLRTARGATVDALPADLVARATDADIPTVWVVLADDQESGYDLDNRTTLIGTYGSLAVAVAAIYRQIVMGERIHRPAFTQRVIQTIVPAGHYAPRGWDSTATPRLTQDGCDYDGATDLSEYGPF